MKTGLPGRDKTEDESSMLIGLADSDCCKAASV